ncbi:MAG: sulfite exporter TauE/SafE family protein [Leptospirales bacterium]|nr:sulfite exporter TauE/SafE family protein [Leptospirales bacterium]
MEIFTDVAIYINTNYPYWFVFPVAMIVACTASASGFSSGVILQPFYDLFLGIPLVDSIATSLGSQTLGTSSATIRYAMYKMIDAPIGFTLLMLTIPGIIVGNHALVVINENLIKLFLGFVVLLIAIIQIHSAIKQKFGTRMRVPIEDVYKVMVVPPIAGFFSATTGTGIIVLLQPTLEKGLNLMTKRANATAIMVGALANICLTILNLNAGLIKLDLFVFAASGAFAGGQLGPFVAKFLPARIMKIAFSLAVSIIGVFYLYKGIQWVGQ